ncbi:30S ribosomal protein S6e [Thermoproteus uzoniensis 768-20]|uniref:Small ribosomal subunit protein eS6 n=1 Tax=Thermoproteus uzoniensis (strain 768-20) TaxID=999630 RepID=F2L0R5_THEU7|nr:30S ribosomal protein S6e [Thermoproteus uzoniensis]AEA12730.1 30S ribosomal protein S6e [Thermoproteus uzoniensis 768-20]
MPTFKVVVSDPMSGKAIQLEVKDPAAQRFIGLKIGDYVDASILPDLKAPQGARLLITGGSGIEGAPMLPGVPGQVKKYAILSGGPGYKPRKEGERKKKLVRGNTISDQIVQINTVLVYPEGYRGPPAIAVGVKEAARLTGQQQAEGQQS